MKMKQNLLSYITLGAGLAGAGVSFWAASLEVDDRGLLPAGHPSAIVTCLLIAIVIGFLMLMLRSVRGELPYKELFAAKGLELVGSLTATGGIVATSVTTLISAETTFATLASVCGFLAAVCLMVVGFLRSKQQRPHYIFHGIVTIYLLLYLILHQLTVLETLLWSLTPLLLSEEILPDLCCRILLVLHFNILSLSPHILIRNLFRDLLGYLL
jgi:hypothetical protein